MPVLALLWLRAKIMTNDRRHSMADIGVASSGTIAEA